MKNLIRLQLRNVFKNKFFYVCLGFSLLLSPILSFILSLATKEIVTDYRVFPQFVSFLTSEVGLASTIFICLFTCFDFNEGTTKNIIARGFSKKQLLFSKYIVSLIGLFISYVAVFLVTLVLFFNKGMGFEVNQLMVIGVSLFSVLAYTIFYATLSFILEKNGSALIACLFAPQVLSLIITAIESNAKVKISQYWLSGVADKFMTKPTLPGMTIPILMYVGYSVLFTFIGIQVIKNKEIK